MLQASYKSVFVRSSALNMKKKKNTTEHSLSLFESYLRALQIKRFFPSKKCDILTKMFSKSRISSGIITDGCYRKLKSSCRPSFCQLALSNSVLCWLDVWKAFITPPINTQTLYTLCICEAGNFMLHQR